MMSPRLTQAAPDQRLQKHIHEPSCVTQCLTGISLNIDLRSGARIEQEQFQSQVKNLTLPLESQLVRTAMSNYYEH